MKQRGLLLALFVGLLASSLNAQQPDLERLDQKLRNQLETKMPGWSYERGEPMQGSKGVLIQRWFTQNRSVSIKVVQMKSAQEAREVLQNFPGHTKGAKSLEDLGDQAYTWGYRSRQVVFRRGKNIIYVEAGATVDLDPDARSLTWSQRRAREEVEVKKLTGAFAKHLVDALDTP
jgi:hypothetical protein